MPTEGVRERKDALKDRDAGGRGIEVCPAALRPLPPAVAAAVEQLAKERVHGADAQDRRAQVIEQVLRRAGVIDDVKKYVKRLLRVFWLRTDRLALVPRGIRPFVSRVVWAEKHLHQSVELNRDEGGRPRWRDRSDVAADLVVLADEQRQKALAAKGGRTTPEDGKAPSKSRKRPALTVSIVDEVRAALRRRTTTLEGARDERAADASPPAFTADNIQAIDETLRRSKLAAHDKQVIAATLFAYSLHGQGATTTLAQRSSKWSNTTITPGAIEWHFHGLLSELRGEAIGWCVARSDFDDGLRWVFSSFESAAALDAACTAGKPTLNPAKALALIGQHLGLSNPELQPIGRWDSANAVAVKLNKARETLRRAPPRPAGCAFELPPMTMLQSLVPAEVVKHLGGFPPHDLLIPDKTHEEKLEFLEARWFKRTPDSGSRGKTMQHPMNHEVGASADDVVRTMADWWNDEGAREHLLPGELRLSLSPSFDQEVGVLARRAAKHLEACESCRAFRTALIKVTSASLEDDGAPAIDRVAARRARLRGFARLRAWLAGEGPGPVRRWPALILGAALGISIVAGLPSRTGPSRIEISERMPTADDLVDVKGGAGGFSSDISCVSSGKSAVLSSGDRCPIGSLLRVRVYLPVGEQGALSVLMCRSKPSQCRFLSGPSSPLERRPVEMYWPLEGPGERAHLLVLWTKGTPDKARIEKNLNQSPDTPDITTALHGVPHTQGILRTFEIAKED